MSARAQIREIRAKGLAIAMTMLCLRETYFYAESFMLSPLPVHPAAFPPSSDGTIHVACGTDDAMLDGALVLAASLIATARGDRPIVFHLLHAPSRRNLPRLAARLTRSNFRVVLHPMGAEYAGLKVGAPYSAATLFRLSLAERLPEVDRVIYLDADTIVCADIAALYDHPLVGHPLAAVPDHHLLHFALHAPIPIKDRFGPALLYLKEELGIVYRQATDYFNAGVILADLAAWRGMRLGERCRAFIGARRLQWWEQDALNAVLAGNYLPLDARWNAIASTIEQRVAPGAEAARALQRLWRDDPWIAHFAGPTKPWHFSPAPTPHADRFWRFAAASPVRWRLRTRYGAQALRAGISRLTNGLHRPLLR